MASDRMAHDSFPSELFEQIGRVPIMPDRVMPQKIMSAIKRIGPDGSDDNLLFALRSIRQAQSDKMPNVKAFRTNS